MIAFESRKRSANPNKISSLNVALPFSFIDFYRRNIGHDVSISFYDYFVSSIINMNNRRLGRLSISSAAET